METTHDGERRTGRTTKQLAAAVEAARAGYTVFFFSLDQAQTTNNIYKCRAWLDRSPFGYEVHANKKQLRTGAGTIRFRTLERDPAQRLLRPSLAPELNRDQKFADALRGLSLASLQIDHHAEYALDRDERRARALQSFAEA